MKLWLIAAAMTAFVFLPALRTVAGEAAVEDARLAAFFRRTSTSAFRRPSR